LGHLTGEIEAAGAVAAAIAVTATFSQKAFAASLGAHFSMLSDWEGETAAAYGVQYETWKGHRGLAKRSVFVIDRDGIIRYRWHTDDALVEPNLEEAVAVLRALADGGGAG
jgi:peroxiredoxin